MRASGGAVRAVVRSQRRCLARPVGRRRSAWLAQVLAGAPLRWPVVLDRLRHDPVLCRRVVVGTVVLAALTVRLLAIVGWAQHVLPAGGGAVYWRQAGYLAAGDGFVYRNNLGELVPTAVHPPLYSGVLGVVALLGVEDHVPFRLVGALIGAATAGVVALVALRLAGWRAGLVAGLIAAVQPNLWFNDVKLTAESVFALAVALVLCASYRLVDRPSTWNTSLLATTIGVAALARAEALLLYPLLLVPLVWRDAASPWRARLLRAAWGLAVVVVVIAPWVVRNATTFERPVALSSGAGFVLEISNCDQTYGLAPPVGA